MSATTYRCPWCQRAHGIPLPHDRYRCPDCAVTFYAWATLGGEYLLLVRPRAGTVWHIETTGDRRERLELRAGGVNANQHGAVREAIVVARTDTPQQIAALRPPTPVPGATAATVQQRQMTF